MGRGKRFFDFSLYRRRRGLLSSKTANRAGLRSDLLAPVTLQRGASAVRSSSLIPLRMPKRVRTKS